jgi:hypothetical protein
VRPSSLLIAYDAENPADRRFVDRLQQRDHWGLIIPFPIQNPELVRMAPELAGRALHLEMHALNCLTREIFTGRRLWYAACMRLPLWSRLALVVSLPFMGARSLKVEPRSLPKRD